MDAGNSAFRNRQNGEDGQRPEELRPFSHDAMIVIALPTRDNDNPATDSNASILQHLPIIEHCGQKYHVLTLGDPDPPTNTMDKDFIGVRAKIIAYREQHYISHLEVSFYNSVINPLAASNSKASKYLTNTAALHFRLSDLTGAPLLHMLRRESADYATTKAQLQKVQNLFQLSEETAEKLLDKYEILFNGVLESNCERLASTALFSCQSTEFAPQMEQVQAMILSANAQRPLLIEYLIAGIGFGNDHAHIVRCLTDTNDERTKYGDYIPRKLRLFWENKQVNPNGDNRTFGGNLFKSRTRFVFFMKEDYFTIYHHGLYAELDQWNGKQAGFREYAARFMPAPKSGDNAWFMLIDQVASEMLPRPVDAFDQELPSVRFTKGDAIVVNLKGVDGERTHDWHGRIISSLPFARPADICAVIHRKFVEATEPDTAGHWDNTVIPHSVCLPIEQQTHKANVRTKLGSLDFLTVTIRLQDDDNALIRQTFGLGNLWNQAKRHGTVMKQVDMLIAKQPSQMPASRLFQIQIDRGLDVEDVNATFEAVARSFKLNASQLQVLTQLSSPMPAGLLLIDGAAGSGKSEVIKAIVTTAMALKLRSSAGKCKILFVTSANQLVDHAVLKLVGCQKQATEVATQLGSAKVSSEGVRNNPTTNNEPYDNAQQSEDATHIPLPPSPNISVEKLKEGDKLTEDVASSADVHSESDSEDDSFYSADDGEHPPAIITHLLAIKRRKHPMYKEMQTALLIYVKSKLAHQSLSEVIWQPLRSKYRVIRVLYLVGSVYNNLT